jgi:hypothetical protein
MGRRAGRKGKDDLEAVLELIEAEVPIITSRLAPEEHGIGR